MKKPTGPEFDRCRSCDRLIPPSEAGWNRARVCIDCRARALAVHALSDSRDEEDDECP